MTTSTRKLIHSPNPSWKPGDKIAPPFSEQISIDPSTVPPADIYKIMIGSIVPRPVAFVSTINNSGQANLAPFSFFCGVSSKPPCLAISVTRTPQGGDKDTWINIRETGEFVVNSANEWLAEPLAQCSADYPYGVSEFERVGLTPLNSVKVRAPRVSESAIQMECKLHTFVEIGDGTPGSSTLIIGEIVLIHIAKSAYKDGKVVFSEIRPISRLGGISYGLTTELFEIPRPKA